MTDKWVVSKSIGTPSYSIVLLVCCSSIFEYGYVFILMIRLVFVRNFGCLVSVCPVTAHSISIRSCHIRVGIVPKSPYNWVWSIATQSLHPLP